MFVERTNRREYRKCDVCGKPMSWKIADALYKAVDICPACRKGKTATKLADKNR